MTEAERAADVLVCAILNRRFLPREELIALVLAYGAAQAAAQRERDAGLADAAAQEYSARYAVDAPTADYLTGAETCARRIAALIRSP